MAVLHATTTGAIGGTGVVHLVTGVVLAHSAAANAVLQDTAGHVIATLRTGGAGSDPQFFSSPVLATGLDVATLSAGTLDIHVE